MQFSNHEPLGWFTKCICGITFNRTDDSLSAAHRELQFRMPRRISLVPKLNGCSPILTFTKFELYRNSVTKLFKKVANDSNLVNNLFTPDKDHFYIGEFVCKQNGRYWTPENRREDEKGNATTLTSERYVYVHETFVAE